MKNYTHNWNSEFITNTNRFLNEKFKSCLEIGSFEGLTSNYIVDNLLTKDGILTCIDPLSDVYLNDNLSEKDIENNNTEFVFFKDQYSRFYNNTKEHLKSGKINLIRDLSVNVFDSIESTFDFIYIDGDHRPEGVYIDAINSFRLCNIGGYILFDDYKWNDTGIGIDRFLNEYKDKYELLVSRDQVLIKKL